MLIQKYLISLYIVHELKWKPSSLLSHFLLFLLLPLNWLLYLHRFLYWLHDLLFCHRYDVYLWYFVLRRGTTGSYIGSDGWGWPLGTVASQPVSALVLWRLYKILQISKLTVLPAFQNSFLRFSSWWVGSYPENRLGNQVTLVFLMRYVQLVCFLIRTVTLALIPHDVDKFYSN